MPNTSSFIAEKRNFFFKFNGLYLISKWYFIKTYFAQSSVVTFEFIISEALNVMHLKLVKNAVKYKID